MTTALSLLRLLAVALCVMSAGVWAADSVVEKSKSTAAAAADIQKLVQQLGVQRDSMISEHEALAKQLKDATEVQKKAILEKMAAQKKAFEEATSALHKQIRDEQRRQRQNAAPGKR
ncbi:MAG: hypothetical protein WCQ89_14175 [Verrucomicrobiota bacterium]|jgi:K+/H+ antiporter YhaU regulatory subunit KhtT